MNPTAKPERIGKYLRVSRLANPGRRTGRWVVLANDGDEIAEVSWYSRWRQYTFDPAACTTWNAGCLEGIVAFLKVQNAKSRGSRTKEAAECGEQEGT